MHISIAGLRANRMVLFSSLFPDVQQTVKDGNLKTLSSSSGCADRRPLGFIFVSLPYQSVPESEEFSSWFFSPS